MWRISKGRIDSLIVFRAAAQGYVPLGELSFEGGDQRFGTFRYARSYLHREDRRAIDPIGLPLVPKVYRAHPHEVPLAFYDAGPDGWGKGVLIMAYPQRRLGMAEFLALGSNNRTGDLAFGPTPDGPETWIPEDSALLALPSDADDLRKLHDAALAVEQRTPTPDHLHLLLRTSANVGGARPKARFRHDGREWIAKFETWGDRFDEPKVEAACLDVAEAAGIRVPERQIVTIGPRSILLVQRFDRAENDRRYGYLSAATLMKQSPVDYATEHTYSDIAKTMRAIGVKNPEPEMFRRLLVNAYLHNTDDHLRNHAIIDAGNGGSGWQLSPAFDIVPTDRDRHVAGPAPGMNPAWNPAMSLSSYPHFNLGKAQAEDIHDQVVAAVRQIDRFLDQRDVTKKDRETLRPHFRYCYEPVAKIADGAALEPHLPLDAP